MASNSEKLWQYAQNIATPCEESRRAKISRAYYSLFHHASAFHQSLDEQGLVLKHGRGGDHQQLIQQLTNPTCADPATKGRSRAKGSFLMLARDLRNTADYDNSAMVDARLVSKCLGFVEKGLAA